MSLGAGEFCSTGEIGGGRAVRRRDEPIVVQEAKMLMLVSIDWGSDLGGVKHR